MNETSAFNAGIPALGTYVLYAVVLGAAVSFALSLRAAADQSPAADRALRAARMAALGTCALVAFDVLLLLYAFVSHDFRVRYVMRYSDRSMPIAYLFTALWGGQDGSLLWWTFLLSLYTGACMLWIRGRYRILAPYVIAVLMVLLSFFAVLMAFAANPFSANVAGAPPDGNGLEPSLQNLYMAIHPPSLYTGFVGCAVPFAFVVAALLAGRLDDEWILAIRKWALFAWLFLSIGNVLGMLWAYEELGWGGYWAWDPVENAACMPWFTMSAYLHSAIIQERRGALKVWNVSLVLLTYLLTIFGTFLTRSGLISSIHAFAQSGVGTYFLWFMLLLVGVCVALVAWRLPMLKKEMEIDAVLSREAMFIANNWLLLGIGIFIVLATTWPKISQALWNEQLTVGPSFYNGWLSIPGILLLGVVGVGTLTPWRKGSSSLLWRSFRWPLLAFVTVFTAHVVFGGMLGYPWYVHVEPIYNTRVGRTLALIDGALPPFGLGFVAFNITAVVQEFWRGTEARSRSKSESFGTAFTQLISRNRRRYGGYLVHLGIALMFLGFIGSGWKQEGERTLRTGESFSVGRYTLTLHGTRTVRDPNVEQLFIDLDVLRSGESYATISPAKFRYSSHPDKPTSEVSITTSLRDDLYVVVASVNRSTGVAHVKAYVNPLTIWIWLGALVLVLGAVVAMWPQVSVEPVRSPSSASNQGGGGTRDAPVDAPVAARSSSSLSPSSSLSSSSSARTGTVIAIMLGLSGVLLVSRDAHAQNHRVSLTARPQQSDTAEERALFHRLLCMCGDCQRLPLETCECDWANDMRDTMRKRLAAGESADSIVESYVAVHKSAALAVPPDAGHNRAMYIIPIVAAAGGLVLAVRLIARWRARGTTVTNVVDARDEMNNKRLDEDLRGLDD